MINCSKTWPKYYRFTGRNLERPDFWQFLKRRLLFHRHFWRTLQNTNDQFASEIGRCKCFSRKRRRFASQFAPHSLTKLFQRSLQFSRLCSTTTEISPFSSRKIVNLRTTVTSWDKKERTTSLPELILKGADSIFVSLD